MFITERNTTVWVVGDGKVFTNKNDAVQYTILKELEDLFYDELDFVSQEQAAEIAKVVDKNINTICAIKNEVR